MLFEILYRLKITIAIKILCKGHGVLFYIKRGCPFVSLAGFIKRKLKNCRTTAAYYVVMFGWCFFRFCFIFFFRMITLAWEIHYWHDAFAIQDCSTTAFDNSIFSVGNGILGILPDMPAVYEKGVEQQF